MFLVNVTLYKVLFLVVKLYKTIKFVLSPHENPKNGVLGWVKV